MRYGNYYSCGKRSAISKISYVVVRRPYTFCISMVLFLGVLKNVGLQSLQQNRLLEVKISQLSPFHSHLIQKRFIFFFNIIIFPSCSVESSFMIFPSYSSFPKLTTKKVDISTILQLEKKKHHPLSHSSPLLSSLSSLSHCRLLHFSEEGRALS